MPTPADLIDAIKKGDLEKATALLAEDPSLASAKNEKGDSVLLVSIYYNQPDISQALIAAGAPAGLIEACGAGLVDKIRELCAANPTAVKALLPNGFAPIHMAAYFGQVKAVRALIGMGADIEAISGKKNTALQAACSGGRNEVVNCLIATGVDVNSKNSPTKQSPLHIAARQGNVALLRLLLDAGADVSAKNEEGKTPFNVATDAGNAEVAELLGKYGAAH